MAIGADNIALRGLSEQVTATPQRGAPPGEHERLLARIPVIEVHLVRREAAATVRTRHVTELAEERNDGVLTTPHPVDLALAVSGVVGGVGRTLVPFPSHA